MSDIEHGNRRRGRPKGGKLQIDWNEIDELLVKGELRAGNVVYPTYNDLAARYGISKSLISKYAVEHGVRERKAARQNPPQVEVGSGTGNGDTGHGGTVDLRREAEDPVATTESPVDIPVDIPVVDPVAPASGPIDDGATVLVHGATVPGSDQAETVDDDVFGGDGEAVPSAMADGDGEAVAVSPPEPESPPVVIADGDGEAVDVSGEDEDPFADSIPRPAAPQESAWADLEPEAAEAFADPFEDPEPAVEVEAAEAAQDDQLESENADLRGRLRALVRASDDSLGKPEEPEAAEAQDAQPAPRQKRTGRNKGPRSAIVAATTLEAAVEERKQASAEGRKLEVKKVIWEKVDELLVYGQKEVDDATGAVFYRYPEQQELARRFFMSKASISLFARENGVEERRSKVELNRLQKNVDGILDAKDAGEPGNGDQALRICHTYLCQFEKQLSLGKVNVSSPVDFERMVRLSRLLKGEAESRRETKHVVSVDTLSERYKKAHSLPPTEQSALSGFDDEEDGEVVEAEVVK